MQRIAEAEETIAATLVSVPKFESQIAKWTQQKAAEEAKLEGLFDALKGQTEGLRMQVREPADFSTFFSELSRYILL